MKQTASINPGISARHSAIGLRRRYEADNDVEEITPRSYEPTRPLPSQSFVWVGRLLRRAQPAQRVGKVLSQLAERFDGELHQAGALGLLGALEPVELEARLVERLCGVLKLALQPLPM